MFIGFTQHVTHSGSPVPIAYIFKLFRVLCAIHLNPGLKTAYSNIDTQSLIGCFSGLIKTSFLDESDHIKPIYEKSDSVKTFIWIYQTLKRYPTKDQATQWALAFTLFMFEDSDHLEKKMNLIDAQVKAMEGLVSDTTVADKQKALEHCYQKTAHAASDIRLAVKMLFGTERVEEDFKVNRGFRDPCMQFRKKEGIDKEPLVLVEVFSSPAIHEKPLHCKESLAHNKKRVALQAKIESRLSWLRLVSLFTFGDEDTSLLKAKLTILNAMLSNMTCENPQAIGLDSIDKQRSAFFQSGKTRTRELHDEYQELMNPVP
ncbi:hypothetical protein [Legionella rubrilucens]|uniref:hypothetical protein n=1 Tax=Legionella rubrilucens TaxID=458 RepID=UPI00105459A0|nr:hypothetical protein [Legionella rubrilucens]